MTDFYTDIMLNYLYLAKNPCKSPNLVQDFQHLSEQRCRKKVNHQTLSKIYNICRAKDVGKTESQNLDKDFPHLSEAKMSENMNHQTYIRKYLIEAKILANILEGKDEI